LGAEYKLAIQKEISAGHINESHAESAQKHTPPHMKKQQWSGVFPRTGCMGYKLREESLVPPDGSLVQRGIHVHPTTLFPYTISCDHNPCDLTAYWKFALTTLIAMDLVDEGVLQNIKDHSWANVLDEVEDNGQNSKELIANFKGPVYEYLWTPHTARNLKALKRLVFFLNFQSSCKHHHHHHHHLTLLLFQ
jgi:hypothetical protein